VPSCRELAALLDEIDGENEAKGPFNLFVTIDTETDHLPLGAERANWDMGALAERDEEISRVEDFYRTEVFSACRELIRRYEQD
jgi:hypothetical protein